jgi:hypothetical protein
MRHITTHQPVEETFRNSLCRDIGHDWRATAASNYRICTRVKCRAAQYLHQGRWADATTRSAKTQAGAVSAHTEQAVTPWAAPVPTWQGA